MSQPYNIYRPPKRASGCLWAVIISQSLLLLVVFMMFAGFVGTCMPATPQDAGIDDKPVLKEVWSCGSGETKVARIPLAGFIGFDNDGLLAGSTSTEFTLKCIHRATGDPSVRAILLEVDSGGGGITASDILHKALLDFRNSQPGRRIVSIFGDTAASGAYYAAVVSDSIIARPTSITGSIGVALRWMNVKELGDKIGLKDVTLKSGENKDLLSPFKDMNDESWETQRALLKTVIDELHQRFISLVASGRGMPEQDVRKLADGSIFTATQAKRLGLVDDVGYWDDAVRKTAELLGGGDIKIYRYEQHFSLSAFLTSSAKVNPSAIVGKICRPRFLYLWQP